MAFFFLNPFYDRDEMMPFIDYFENNVFFDVNITSQSWNKTLQSHKLVLATKSAYFLEYFKNNNKIYHNIQMKYDAEVIEMILHYIYYGKVQCPTHKLDAFQRTANELGVSYLMFINLTL